MAAASRGAVVAVLPGTDADGANDHADLALCTGVGEARDLAVVASADAVIAVGGGWGTLVEIGRVSVPDGPPAHRETGIAPLRSANSLSVRKVGRPVVLLRSWRIESPDGQGRAPGCLRAETPEQAVALALESVP